jgi:nitrate reductase (NAD(P)H)
LCPEQYLDSLSIGSEVEMKGPTGEFVYLGGGRYSFQRAEKAATHISMIAGGTGITPCYQVRDPDEPGTTENQ